QTALAALLLFSYCTASQRGGGGGGAPRGGRGGGPRPAGASACAGSGAPCGVEAGQSGLAWRTMRRARPRRAPWGPTLTVVVSLHPALRAGLCCLSLPLTLLPGRLRAAHLRGIGKRWQRGQK